MKNQKPFIQSLEFQDALEIPDHIQVVPVNNVLLMPKGLLPIVFTDRHDIETIESLAQDKGIVGLVQRRKQDEFYSSDEYVPRSRDIEIFRVGCLGEILTAYYEEDGLCAVIRGICRFQIQEEIFLNNKTGYKIDVNPYAKDLENQEGSYALNRDYLYQVIADNGLKNKETQVALKDLFDRSDEKIITTLAMAGPFSIGEKQAILEAESLEEQASLITKMMEMSPYVSSCTQH